MLGKERPCKVHQIRDDAVVGVCPERGELKAVTGLAMLGLRRCGILDGVKASGVRVVFGVRAIGDNEYLNIIAHHAVLTRYVQQVDH